MRIRRQAGSEKKGWMQTADRRLPAVGNPLSGRAARAHRRRSDAGGSQVDRSDAAGDFAAAGGTGNPGRPGCRQTTAQEARVRQTQGPQEGGDGAAPSRQQRPVREHRPAETGVHGRRPAGAEHRHQEEGTAGQLLSRRQTVHAGGRQGLRPRLPLRRHRRGPPAWAVRFETESRPHQPGYQPRDQ